MTVQPSWSKQAGCRKIGDKQAHPVGHSTAMHIVRIAHGQRMSHRHTDLDRDAIPPVCEGFVAEARGTSQNRRLAKWPIPEY